MLNKRLGIVGSGQLCSFLCVAAKKLKISTTVFTDDKDGPAQNFCDYFIYGKYNDKEKIREFIENTDIATYEFENIPVEFLKLIEKERPVLPNPNINKIAQNRKLEKTFVNELGIKTTDWVYIKSAEDIKKNQNLLPGILKSNTLGYDGKGQFVLNSLDDVQKDWCFTADYILENVPGAEIYGIKRWRSRDENISHLMNNERVTFIEADLTDRGSLNRAIRIFTKKA